MSRKDNKKIIKLPRSGGGSNVGKVVFFIILFVYIVFAVYSFSNKTTVSYYEVEEGSIVREHIYKGIILRDELIVPSERSGYLNYYVASGKKVAVGSAVYSVDESGTLNEYLQSHADELQGFSDSDLSSIHRSLEDHAKQAQDISFSSTYSLASDLEAMVTEYKNLSILTSMGEELRAEGITLNEFRASSTGMLSYVVDGYEDLTVADIEASLFDENSYTRQMINNGELTAAGDPAYKLITSDDWQIVFQLSDQDLADFGDSTSLRLDLSDTGITTTAGFETIIGKDGNSYGVLSLSGYLPYFYNDRFISFELIQNDVSGLKIPEKSITTKDFYVIPSELLASDDKGNSGFYKEVITETGTASEFSLADIYNNDGEYCYIECTDSGELKPGDVIVSRDDSSERYMINEQKPLEGVYCINKGYTEFKRIERLDSSNGYCIIARNTSYGLSVYDHIVLDASVVGDGQLLYR